MAGLRIEKIGERGVSALRAFLETNYDGCHPLLNERYFDHWFRPDGRGPSIIVALMNDAVVGFQGLIERKITWRGTDVLAAWYCHTYVAKQHRGRGIGLKMLEHSVSLYDNILTLSYTDAAGALLKRLGFNFFLGGGLRRYWRLLDRQAFSRLPHALPQAADLAAYPPDGPPKSARIFRPDSELECSWHEMAPTLGLTTARSGEYLRMRYFDHPVHEYHILVPRQRSACAVVRFEPQAMPMAARVVDLWGAPECAAGLLADTAAYAAERGASFVDYYATSSVYEKSLSEAGFDALVGDAAWQVPYLFNPPELRTRYNERFAARLTGLPDDGPRLLDECYFVKGDGDRDR